MPDSSHPVRGAEPCPEEYAVRIHELRLRARVQRETRALASRITPEQARAEARELRERRREADLQAVDLFARMHDLDDEEE